MRFLMSLAACTQAFSFSTSGNPSLRDPRCPKPFIDVMEEFYKSTLVSRERSDCLVARYGERNEKAPRARRCGQPWMQAP